MSIPPPSVCVPTPLHFAFPVCVMCFFPPLSSFFPDLSFPFVQALLRPCPAPTASGLCNRPFGPPLWFRCPVYLPQLTPPPVDTQSTRPPPLLLSTITHSVLGLRFFPYPISLGVAVFCWRCSLLWCSRTFGRHVA